MHTKKRNSNKVFFLNINIGSLYFLVVSFIFLLNSVLFIIIPEQAKYREKHVSSNDEASWAFFSNKIIHNREKRRMKFYFNFSFMLHDLRFFLSFINKITRILKFIWLWILLLLLLLLLNLIIFKNSTLCIKIHIKYNQVQQKTYTKWLVLHSVAVQAWRPERTFAIWDRAPRCPATLAISISSSTTRPTRTAIIRISWPCRGARRRAIWERPSRAETTLFPISRSRPRSPTTCPSQTELTSSPRAWCPATLVYQNNLSP